MKKENNKWYIGWIIFPAWYLIGKKYIILPVIQSVFEAMSYSDAYLITNYLWNLIAIVILFSLYGTGILRDIKQIRQYDIKSIASGYIKSFAVIVLFTILAGIAFCLVYIKRGNVVFGIAAHMSINLMHNLMYLVNQ